MIQFDTGIDDACLDFRNFIVNSWDTEEALHPDYEYKDSVYIGDYLSDWLSDDKDGAVVCTRGDYTLYLQVVIAIIDKSFNDPEFLVDSKGRRRHLRGLTDPNELRNVFVDRHNYESTRFNLRSK